MRPRRWRIIPNWRRVLFYAWSVRWMALSLVFYTIGDALPLLAHYLPLSPFNLALLSLAAALVARFIEQPKVSG